MSAKLMGQVWELQLHANEQIVLLALADHARDDGSSVYPSVAYLAWKVGCSERTVQRILRALESAKLIEDVSGKHGGRNHTTVYQIHVTNGVKKSPFATTKGCHIDTAIKGDNLSKGDKYDTQRVTNQVVKGDIAVSPEPLENHQLEPSEREYARNGSPEISASSPEKNGAQNSREMFDLNGADDDRYHTPHYLALLDVCDLDDNTLQLDPRKRAFAAGVAVQLATSYTPEQFGIARANWPYETAPTPKQFAVEIKKLLNRKEVTHERRLSKSERNLHASIVT